MTPAAYVYRIIADNIASIPGIDVDHVYTFYIDDDPVAPDVFVLITETVGMSDDYGNNEAVYSNKRVQIDLYYPKDYDQDMAALERQLKQVLRDHEVYCYSDAGHVLTLDSKNITNTLKFNLKMEE